MTAAAGVLLALTLVSACIDWLAVRHGHRPCGTCSSR